MSPIRSSSGSAIVRLERPSSAPSLAQQQRSQKRVSQRTSAGERRASTLDHPDDTSLLGRLCASLFAPEPDHLAPNPKDPLAPFRTRVFTAAVEERMDTRADVRAHAARLSGPFSRATPPPIALPTYLSRFVRFAISQPPSLSLALSLIDRLQEAGCPCTTLSVHRLIAATISLASKMVEEVRISRSAFCRVAGLDRKELAMLEEVAFQLLHSTVLGSGGSRWERAQAEMGRRAATLLQPHEVRLLRVHAARLGIDLSSDGSSRTVETVPPVVAASAAPSTSAASSSGTVRRPTRSGRSTRSLRSTRSRRSVGYPARGGGSGGGGGGGVAGLRDSPARGDNPDSVATSSAGSSHLERARSLDGGSRIHDVPAASGTVRRRRRASTIAAEVTKMLARRRPTWRTRSSSMERATSAPSADRHHHGKV